MNTAGLVAALEAAGVPVEWEDVRDSLWLAAVLAPAYVEPAGLAPAPPPLRQIAPDPVVTIRPEPLDQPRAEQLAPAERSVEEPAGVFLPGAAPVSDRAVPVRIAVAPPRLADAARITRQLRPLKKQAEVPRQLIVDERATVDRIAETGLWQPVLTRPVGRSLNLDVVVDDSPSMRLWDRPTAALVELLTRLGVFRRITTWRLETGGRRLLLRTTAEEEATRDPRQLVDLTGRSVVLLVSDGISPAWHTGAVDDVLRDWSAAGPVAIWQPLAPRLWRRTAMQVRSGVISANRAGQPVADYSLRMDDAVGRRTIGVPVINSGQTSLGAWARLLGAGGTETTTLRLVAANPTARSPVDEPAELDPNGVITRFRTESSATAMRLAVYFSAIPLTVQTMRVAQEVMLPESSESHLAEVFLGGLLQTVAAPRDRVYDFTPGVREALLAAITRTEARAVLDRVADAAALPLAQRQGFRAVLDDPLGAGVTALSIMDRPFAKVMRTVLSRLGGPQAELAEGREGSRFSARSTAVNEVVVQVFDQTGDNTRLRLTTAAGTRTRSMNKAAVTELVETVEAVYRRDAVAQRVFGNPQLRELGERLFGFLDGDKRWLTPAVEDPRGTTLRISAEHRLRHLPWELNCVDGVPLAVREPAPVLPVRTVRTTFTHGAPVVGNRPLRVLFMAASPEGVEPVLNFEAEEAGILAATLDTGTELVVEDSGTLEGLRFAVESYGAGYFDVLHLSGHADVPGGQPRFLVENELGGPVLASAGDIARALDGQWPRLVFVSGCWTGVSPDEGAVPSMSESLVDAGAPVVLGWALPVGDVAASTFAAHLYRDLAAGRRVDRAVITARRALYAEQNRNWHLLRVYADASPLTPMVTPRHTPGRATIQVRLAATQFLDPATQVSRVASRAEFVGRRRVIQRCLRTLKQPLDKPGAAEALVLQGVGGLGKSTLASRLLERMPTYQRVVWYGRVDEARLRELVGKIAFPSPDMEIEAADILGTPNLDLARRLEHLLRGPLAAIPCLFVFDDFEQGNLDERATRDGGHVLSSEMAQILPALLAAIRQTNSSSRVIITSRYAVPTPTGAGMTTEALETFTPAEQTKKITNLPHLRPEASTPGDIKARAIEAAAGNPRLLDWLDKIVSAVDVDVEEMLTAIEAKAVEFRESIFAERLLTSQPVEIRTMLARVNVVDLPVPAVTVHALHTHPQAEVHMRRAADLGLLEEGTDPDTEERRYFVSNVLRPLLRPLLSDEQYRDACATAARSLNEQGPQDATQVVEMHRLAVAAGEAGIARMAEDKLSRGWLVRSRFAEVITLAEATLTLGEYPGSLYHLGWALRATGRPLEALTAYEQALSLYRTSGDRSGEAATLSNIGLVHDGLGDRARALRFYEAALPIRREVGDRAGEATTLNNIGLVHDGLGDRARALQFYEAALPIRREVGDRAGEATTLNNIGGVHDGLEDRARALQFYEAALPIHREVGDRAGEAATLTNIGTAQDGLGDRARALQFYEVALPIRREVGDRAGEAVTLTNIGAVHSSLGDRVRALQFYEQALSIQREVGDRASEAVTRFNIAAVYRAEGELARAVTELEQVVDLDRHVSHPDLASDAAVLEVARTELAQRYSSELERGQYTARADPISVITTAMAVGSASIATGIAPYSVQEPYTRLKALLKRRLAGRPTGRSALDQYETDPETNLGALRFELSAGRVDFDQEIIDVAHGLIQRAAAPHSPDGKRRVDMRGSQGVQIGDNSQQLRNFDPPN